MPAAKTTTKTKTATKTANKKKVAETEANPL